MQPNYDVILITRVSNYASSKQTIFCQNRDRKNVVVTETLSEKQVVDDERAFVDRDGGCAQAEHRRQDDFGDVGRKGWCRKGPDENWTRTLDENAIELSRRVWLRAHVSIRLLANLANDD